MGIMAMSTEEVRSRLTAAGEDLNKLAAVAILKDVGDGGIFNRASARQCLRTDGEALRFWWADLRTLIRDNDPDIATLSSTARFALELACALAFGEPIADLGRGLCNLGTYNARVVLDALALPLHIDLTEKD